MESKLVRKKFLDYFKNLDHEIVESSPVIPYDDPTLLFTNAGMNQFKDVLLGIEKRNYKRAASVQKCIRAGGKHNDLENVGKTSRHLTFFEMLGNWSFGDYYKREAIEWAWNFLTRELKLPEEKLLVSIYKDDDESFNIWKNEIKVPAEKIVRLGDIEKGDEENFWSMGPTGPCGPCTELHYDMGEEYSCGRKSCSVGCDCDRYIEVWNNVFMQFNRDSKGKLTGLPMKSVDTGLGFERLCAIMQKVDSNFDTDLFIPIIKKTSLLSGKDYNKNKVNFRVVADHVRCLTFAIADGAVPANEGRGYVLKRILRRASRYGRELGMSKPFLYKLVDEVVKILGEVYPEIPKKKDYIKKIVKSEEKRFLETLDKGLKVFNDIITGKDRKDNKILTGKEAFVLYDTYGFPYDLTRLLAEEKGFTVKEKEFLNEMEDQKERSREKSKFGVSYDLSEKEWTVLNKKVKTTQFTGYEDDEIKTKIVRFREIDEKKIEVVVEKTPFYAESGGQVGDTGELYNNEIIMDVLNTIKSGGFIIHIAHFRKGSKDLIKDFPEVNCRIAVQKRRNTEKNHTATHLLHKSLKMFLGHHVSQAGSLVEPLRLRFDFNHFEKVPADILKKIENAINLLIQKNYKVYTYFTTLEKAKEDGVTALFGEKYGEEVRVVKVNDFSKELCGGTHVSYIGEIGLFKIKSETSISAGIRRIEALTGEEAVKYVEKIETDIQEISRFLNCEQDRILDCVRTLVKEKEDVRKRLKDAESRFLFSKQKNLFDDYIEIDDYKLVRLELKDYNIENIRKIADNFKKEVKNGVIVVANISGDKVNFVAAVTDGLKKKINAGELVKEVAGICGGSGGGRSDFGQAGGRDISKVKKALDKVPEILEKT